MKKRAFTLIELLIIITIIAILVGVALPYYQDYIKQAKLAKAEHELDIIKEALIKYDTMEELPFKHNDLRYLLGNYLQDLPRDPWDRDYHIDWVKGQVWSDGPDMDSIYDDIKVEYKPPLTLQKATWLDLDNNNHISRNDIIRLQFSRCLYADELGAPVNQVSLTNASPAAAGSDIWFTEDVDAAFLSQIVASYPASSSEILLILPAPAVDNPFYPGSSSIRVSPNNTKLTDWVDLADGSGKRKANGSDDTDDVDWIRIKGR
ncbi:MAG: prepilin-type N-terminal cleavage/methylation domain-containing protein [Candidatus Riflebacteria bacterium]|nr:prepilin-type N-terminal cleavage/methylation domain-containing protein [Candidatus Riflebacteria bacterium]